MKKTNLIYGSLFVAIIVVFMTNCGGGGAPSGGGTNGNTSTLTWEIKDSCNDGQRVELRFFDVTDHVQWPADPTQIYPLNYGDDNTYKLNCTTGAKICYGASDSTGYWGVGENNTESCSGCCNTCADTSVTPISLTCPSGSIEGSPEDRHGPDVERKPKPTSSISPSPSSVGSLSKVTLALLHGDRVLNLASHAPGQEPCGSGASVGQLQQATN
jgi:hypothetical protein